jgi:hypothetical protein
MEKARSYRTIEAMFLGLCLVAMTGQAQDANAPPPKPEVSVEDEVLANLHAFDLGPVKLEALAMPDDYLRRVATRVLQSSFEERFRIVVPDPKPGDGEPGSAVLPPISVDDLSHRKLLLSIAVVGLVCVWIGTILLRKRKASSR